MDPITLMALASLVGGGIQYGAGQRQAKREKKVARQDRQMAQGRADFMRKWLHPEQKVALEEQNLGGAGSVFDARRERLGDQQKLELMGSQANLDSANMRSKMLREQLRAQQIGGAANALGGLAAMYQPVPQQDPYGGALYGRRVGGPRGMQIYDNGI